MVSQPHAFVLLTLALSRTVLCANTNLTSLVNLFIGTASGANGGSGGNGFPGAAVPHAMAKVGIDVDEVPRQAGYIHDNSSVTGVSLMHDEGTGGNTEGGYGFFPLFPLQNCTFSDCPVGLKAREALRAANADAAQPGYFTTQFVNGIKLETTSTRRSGLIRFTYPNVSAVNHVVVDLTNDLQRSFEGGGIIVDGTNARVVLNGTFLQSYGTANYTAHACYDFTPPANVKSQPLVAYGTYQSINNSDPTDIVVVQNTTTLSYGYTSSPSPIQAGGLVSFASDVVLARFGVSFISTEQACANAEEEIPDWDWDAVQGASQSKWEDVLSRVIIDTEKENATIVESLYSSLYRASLVPANLTGENPYWDSPYGFWDAFFCSWDVFRTIHPLLSITSPLEWSQIVNAYIDGWRFTGYIPECRDNTKPGYVQGGSDGMPILGDFAVKYGAYANALGVPADDLYQALVDTAENTPPDWYEVGRQNTAWTLFDYIPTNWTDPSGAVGLPTREASRTLEYAMNDFGVRQAGIALGKNISDVYKYGNRSLGFKNVWDPNVTSDGFYGFSQRRFANGTFLYSPPNACSPVDPVVHSCARGTDNDVGFYESSSWEMSFFAPQSMSTMVELMGGNTTFINRVEHYFNGGYFNAGNEPGFEMPWVYHYANRPDLSALRVRNVTFSYFSTGIGGIPGNDDSGAMAALLIFHMLGLYPVPSSNQLLIGSPMVSTYTLTNNFFNTSTTVTVKNFDSKTVALSPPAGSNVYVQSITINGKTSDTICWITFEDLTRGSEIIIVVGPEVPETGCGVGPNALPDSLESGGFKF